MHKTFFMHIILGVKSFNHRHVICVEPKPLSCFNIDDLLSTKLEAKFQGRTVWVRKNLNKKDVLYFQGSVRWPLLFGGRNYGVGPVFFFNFSSHFWLPQGKLVGV